MKQKIDDASVTEAAFERPKEEVVELGDVAISGDRALIVDELVDVVFYVERVRAACGLSDEIVL